jgi:DNA-directed RNA polymerase specialized sigma24 family protein
MLAYLWKTARNYIAERVQADLDPKIGRILEPLTDALLDQVADPASAFPTESTVVSILEGYIDRGIGRLPDRQKTAFTVYITNPDNSHDDNAHLMGIRRQTYERLLRKAQTKLRGFLETECPNLLPSPRQPPPKE